MSKMGAETRIRLMSFVLIIAVLIVWGLFYFIISDYITDNTNKQIALAADHIIEKLGGELSQAEKLLYGLAQNNDVKDLIREINNERYYPLAVSISGSLNTGRSNPDILEHIIVFGNDGRYFRLAGKLGNKSCSRLYGIVSAMNLPTHVSVDFEGKKYIGSANEIILGDGEPPGIAVILIEEEKILETLLEYDQSGSLLLLIKANGKMVTANTGDIDVFEAKRNGPPVTHSRLGITPFEISVTTDSFFHGASTTYFTIVALITAVIFGVVFYVYARTLNRRFFRPMVSDKENAEVEKQKALVFSLKKQINAHYTINTLNTIRLLVEQGENKKAETAATGLISLVRYAHDKEETINIWDEFEILEHYMTIMNIRYDGKLTVDFDFDDRLMDSAMPRMILQPIMENAIVHGFKDMDAGCKISAKATLCGEMVFFTVSDNGGGMSEAELSALTEKLAIDPEAARGFDNIALLNIKNRLHHYYGEAGALRIEHHDGGGICVTVTMPYIKQPPKTQNSSLRA